MELNAGIIEKKIWAKGLLEAIIIEQMVSKQRDLEQINRISVILLDSTLEIAFKDYIAFEIDEQISDQKLQHLLQNRTDVHEHVSGRLLVGQEIWKQIAYFYKIRCDIVHRKANVGISDDHVNSYREIVKSVLTAAFGLRFPK